MADQQQQNTGEVSQPYSIPPGMTPEAAAERAEDLITDRDFAARLLKGGKDSREAHELDALQRRATDTRREVARKRPATPAGSRPEALAPATIERSAGLTAAQAAERLAELRSDAAWSRKFLDGDRAAKREFDRLTEIAAQVPEGTPAAPKALTAAEARAAALDAVPETPDGYRVNWYEVSPGDPVPEEGIKSITSWAHAAGLTQSETTTMLPFAGQDVQKWQRMDDDARERHMNDTRARFNKIHGAEAPAMFEGARRLVAELCAKDPTLKSFLEESGAGASLGVITALADAAKRKYRA